MIADRLHQLERTGFRQIVEEDAADAARLAAMFEKEVLIAPALEARVMGANRLLADGVEVARVLFEPVVGREIHAAAEPPGIARREEAHVHVHGGTVGVARMQHERHAHRLERASGELRARRACRRWQRGAVHARQVHAAAFEDAAFLDDARQPAAPLRALPCVATELPAVERLEAPRRCAPAGRREYSWTASFTLISLLQGAVADVLAVLHALEADGPSAS